MLTPSAIVLVQAGAGTSAGAFSLDPGSRFDGFVEFGLAHNAAAGTFALVGAPAPAAYRLLKVSEGSQNLWHDSADAVSAHLATARDTSASGGGFWFQALGEVGDRDKTRTFTNAGFGQSVDLGYRQDDFGGQLGVDLAGGSAEGFRFGFTGGYQNSNLRFETGSDGLSYDGFNVGAYGQLRSGDFYATAWPSSTIMK